MINPLTPGYRLFATLILCINAPVSGWADVDPDIALAVHNEVRRSINRGAFTEQPVPNPPLPMMYWDDQLAAQSKGYAEQCVWQHSTDRINTGENLYASTDLAAATPVAVQAWADEHVDYDFGTMSCTPGEQCGHYTQLAWQDSLLVGCGQATCAPLRDPFGDVLFDASSYVVCRYATAGNIQGQQPYDTAGIALDRLPAYSEDAQQISLPYFLIWNPDNLVEAHHLELRLVGANPIIFAIEQLSTTEFRDEAHVPIYDVNSQRLFVPNLDTLLDGQWSRHSAIFRYVPGTVDPFHLELTHFQ